MTVYKTRAAKVVYKLGGLLSKIKTRQPVFKMANEDEFFRGEVDKIVWEKAGHRWLPCRLSVKTVTWSMSIDPLHWDHWALVHKGCGASFCMDCKGYSCDDAHNDSM